MNKASARSNFAFALTAIPGLLGLFGLGHFYLHRAKRGFAFLAYSGILYGLLAGIFIFPSASVALATIAPAMWFVGWVFAMYDTRRIEKRMLEVSGQRSALEIAR